MDGLDLELDGLDLEVQPDEGEHKTLQVLEDKGESEEVKNRVEVEADEEIEESVESRGQLRPAILQNAGMDTLRPTELLSLRKDTLIQFWPSKCLSLAKLIYNSKHLS